MNTQWELYFLRREIERQKIQKQRKKKRRIWIAGISGLLALVFLAGGISMVRFYRSDYGKLKRAADQYDFRLAAVRMSQYVNEKYGEEVCSSGELSVSPWDPSNLRSYLGFRAKSEDDPGKVIYMLYLTKEKVVYLDTFQWEEISEDLMQEAAEETGLNQVCCDTMKYSELDLREPYYYCPWVAAGAHMTKYEGDLEQFFAEEAKVRQALPDIEKLGELRINGAFALYFGDSAVPTMRERIQNPNVDYREQFETGLKAIEEKYQIDIASAVLFQRVFLEMKQAVTEKESYSIFPTTWMEYEKGETFFSPAYTLLSLSYDQVFEPKAEKAAEGVYVFSTNGRRRMTGYTCKTTKPPEEVRDLAEKELSGWEFDQTLLFHRNENYSTQEYPISYALAIDAEKLYPDQEISVIGWDNLDWAVCQAKEQNLYPPNRTARATYQMEDGFMVFGDTDGYGTKNYGDKLYSILTR